MLSPVPCAKAASLKLNNTEKYLLYFSLKGYKMVCKAISQPNSCWFSDPDAVLGARYKSWGWEPLLLCAAFSFVTGEISCLLL